MQARRPYPELTDLVRQHRGSIAYERGGLAGERDLTVLVFNHINGKAANINRLISGGASIARLNIEIALAVVRCANCRRRKTDKKRGWFRAGRGSRAQSSVPR